MLGSSGLCSETVRGLVFPVDLLSDGVHLTTLQLAHTDRPPSLGGADHRAENELEDRLLLEGVGDDLGPSALLDEETLKKIRGPDCAAVGDRNAQVGDAGFEVVLKGRAHARQLGLVVDDHAAGEIAGDGARWRLAGGGYMGLELGPEVFRHLGCQAAHPMSRAALARRPRETGLDRLDDARSPVRNHPEGIADAAPRHILEEGAYRLGILPWSRLARISRNRCFTGRRERSIMLLFTTS